MGLIILGIIILVIGFTAKSGKSPIGNFKGLLTVVGIIVIIIGFATSAIRQIEAGNVGVQKLFGKVQREILYPGLNFVNPLVDVTVFSTLTQNYTMTSSYDEGQKTGDDAVPVLSKDGLQLEIDLTILYKVIPSEAPAILDSIGVDYESKIIRPQVRSRIRESAVKYDAVGLYSEKREEYEKLITIAIDTDFAKRGFILEDLLVRKINLPPSVKQSIERKLTAEQEAQRMEFVLDKEEREAERKRVEARGVADAQKIIDAGLSNRVLKFEQIKIQRELVNSPNAKIIILGDSKSSPPFIIGN